METGFINYAHRGASSYYPENTLSAFEAGVKMGANGIETDVQMTRDGVCVLFHDDTLERVTGKQGAVSDYTLGELKSFSVKSPLPENSEDSIPTLEEFLMRFADSDIHFAIEIKQPGVEAETVRLLEKYGVRDKTIITSFIFDCLKTAAAIAPGYRLGYLYGPQETSAPEKMKEIGGVQLCPRAEALTKEAVDELHALGFSVRAWGVSDETLMKHVVSCGADGMTVNFPDKLTAFLENRH